MRKIRLYIAMTLDGYIASRDGGVEWLDKYRNNTEDYGYTALYESIDTVLMGGNTYRAILGFGCEWPYPDKTSYVISHREQQGTNDCISIISDNAISFIKQLKAGTGKDIWLVGGGQLTAQLLEERLIDEMQICVFPILLGTGIRLFSENSSAYEWIADKQQSFLSGAILLTYRKP
ncbi:MAG TPA: dihydrofolate reductase [Candidatus Avibacteroides excrementipullorum]|jgi:dihydrofolate reductase|nr:dihydrofolate reductase [Candidatus Avibacteroides excrementipullorum]